MASVSVTLIWLSSLYQLLGASTNIHWQVCEIPQKPIPSNLDRGTLRLITVVESHERVHSSLPKSILVPTTKQKPLVFWWKAHDLVNAIEIKEVNFVVLHYVCNLQVLFPKPLSPSEAFPKLFSAASSQTLPDFMKQYFNVFFKKVLFWLALSKSCQTRGAILGNFLGQR